MRKYRFTYNVEIERPWPSDKIETIHLVVHSNVPMESPNLEPELFKEIKSVKVFSKHPFEIKAIRSKDEKHLLYQAPAKNLVSRNTPASHG